MSDQKTNKQWQQELTPEQYHILREKGTEMAFTGKYDKHFEPGEYTCAGCGATLFVSENKYDSGCGWPAFDKSATDQGIIRTEDTSLGMKRVEVTCAQCGGHLGHVFPDGPRATTGERYCINSAALNFKQQK